MLYYFWCYKIIVVDGIRAIFNAFLVPDTAALLPAR